MSSLLPASKSFFTRSANEQPGLACYAESHQKSASLHKCHDGSSGYVPPPKQTAGSCRCKLTYKRLSSQLLVVDVLFRRFDTVAVGLKELLTVCAYRQALREKLTQSGSACKKVDALFQLLCRVKGLTASFRSAMAANSASGNLRHALLE